MAKRIQTIRGNNERKRHGDPGLAMEIDIHTRSVSSQRRRAAHNLEKSEKEVVKAMMRLAKKARTAPPVRFQFQPMSLGSSTVDVLYTDYDRPNNGGPERAYIFGPLKWKTSQQKDKFPTCASRFVQDEDAIVAIVEAVGQVAAPYAISSRDWEAMMQEAGVTSVTTRNPTNNERNGAPDLSALWAIDFKSKGRKVAMFFLFYGVIFQDIAKFQEFMSHWERQCPGTNLSVLEDALKQVPVPVAGVVRSMDAVNTALAGLAAPNVQQVSAGRRALSYITSFFGR